MRSSETSLESDFWRGLSKPLNSARPYSVWRGISVECLLWRFGATSLRHVHCIFVKVFVTIHGKNWYCYHWTSFVNPISPIVKTICESFLRAWSTTHLYSIVWRLINSEFNKWNSAFYFFVEKSIVIPKRSSMGCHLFCWERFSSISCFGDNLCIVAHLDL